jgi:hypothetical protein
MKYIIDSFVICLNQYGFYRTTAVVFPGLEELENCIELSGYGESDDEMGGIPLLVVNLIAFLTVWAFRM